MSDHPNVLLICTDQQFAGALSCTGNVDLSTPAIDAIGAEGTRFELAYCAQPLCTPSRAAMFSGRMPHTVGVPKNNLPIDPRYRATEMGNLFRAAGYTCGYAGKWHVPEGSMPEDNDHGFEVLCGHNDHALPGAVDSFLRRDHDRPFLLVASFDNPHNICEYARNQPLPWGNVDEPPIEDCPNLPANFEPPPHEPQVLRMMMQASRFVWPTLEYTVDQWRRLRHAYFRLCEKVDREVAGILRTLRETGRLDDTLVVFTSDHGDGHGAHRWNQKWVFYEESSRIPFIVRPPGGAEARVDREHLVSNGLDLLPTLLDYAGIDVPADLPGRSVRPLVDGVAADGWPDELVSETQFLVESPMSNGRMLRTRRYKYVVYAWGQDREQLFDMAADPGEMVDLTVESRHRATLDEHRRRLADWCERTGDRFRVPAPGSMPR